MAISARAYSPNVGEILIYDPIGKLGEGYDGITAKQFDAELKVLGPIKTLILRINSPGGHTSEAAAIIAILSRFKGNGGRVLVYVDGIAVSAASWIAMTGDEIIIAEDAFIMIHEAAANGANRAGEMRVAADLLDKLNASMAADYSARSGQSVERVKKMMADEQWMDAKDAVSLGFADRVEQPMKMAAVSTLKPFSYRNTPTNLEVPKVPLAASDVWAKYNRVSPSALAQRGGR